MTYLVNATKSKRLVRQFQNWCNFYGRLLVITAVVNRKDFGKDDRGDKLWIITEADRSSTCLLLPDEY